MGLIQYPINCWSGGKFFVSNTSPQVKINNNPGMANRANEIINTKAHLKKRLINSAGHRFAEQIN